MFCLMYVSFATQPMRPSEIVDLANQSARDNARDDITGVLLFDDGIFLQVLEGDEAAVRRLMGRIVRDRRHANVSVVMEEDVPARHFPDWHMALADVSALSEGDRAAIRQLGQASPVLPHSVASATITHLIATFHRVVQRPDSRTGPR